jgi:hypothetical protein
MKNTLNKTAVELHVKIQNGEISINEAREIMGLPPIENSDVKTARLNSEGNINQID